MIRITPYHRTGFVMSEISPRTAALTFPRRRGGKLQQGLSDNQKPCYKDWLMKQACIGIVRRKRFIEEGSGEIARDSEAVDPISELSH